MDWEPTYELVRKAQDGDAQAFGELIGRYRSRLESVIHLRMGERLRGKIEPEDIFQEMSLNAFRSIQQFRWVDQGSFFRWLAGVAENVIRNQVRYHFQTKKRLGEAPPAAGVAEAPPRSMAPSEVADPNGVTPLRNLMRQERFHRLENALRSLSSDHREVIILARLQGVPILEIAQRMKRSEDAVSMLLLRALRHLKAIFGNTGSMGLPDQPLAPPQDPPGPQPQEPPKPHPAEQRKAADSRRQRFRYPAVFRRRKGSTWFGGAEAEPGLGLGQ